MSEGMKYTQQMQLGKIVQTTGEKIRVSSMPLQNVKTRTMTDLLSPDSHVVAPLPFRITSCSNRIPCCHNVMLSAQALSVEMSIAIKCRKVISDVSALQLQLLIVNLTQRQHKLCSTGQ